jgi:hypothetical protein
MTFASPRFMCTRLVYAKPEAQRTFLLYATPQPPAPRPPPPPGPLVSNVQNFENNYRVSACIFVSLSNRQIKQAVQSVTGLTYLANQRITHYVRSKTVPVQAMKTYTRSGGIAPLILTLCSRWRSVAKSRPGHFTPGTVPRYPLKRWLRGPRTPVWTIW